MPTQSRYAVFTPQTPDKIPHICERNPRLLEAAARLISISLGVMLGRGTHLPISPGGAQGTPVTDLTQTGEFSLIIGLFYNLVIQQMAS